MTYLLLATVDKHVLATDPEGTQDRLNMLDKTSYDGMTFFHNQYGEDVTQWAKTLKTTKNLWPWITFGPLMKNQLPDFSDAFGGRTSFMQYWRSGLQFVSDTGGFGIVLDPEDYTGTALWEVIPGAAQLGITPEEYKRVLYNFGAEMAEVVCEVSGSIKTLQLLVHLWPETLIYCTGYIAKGFIERGLSHRPPVKMIIGAETQFPYCPDDSNGFSVYHNRNIVKYAPILSKYPNTELGPPIFLYNNQEDCTGWARTRLDAQIAAGTLKSYTAKDFFVPFHKLTDRWDFVWCYSEQVTSGYRPLDPTANKPVNELLLRIRERDKIKTEAPQRKTLYRQRIVNQVSNPAIFDSRAALAEFDRTAFVRPEELT